MSDRAARIDTLARNFAVAAHALAEELAHELGEKDPALAGKVAGAVQMGERMMLCAVIDPAAPEIAWLTVDDYQHQKRIMTIPGIVPPRH